MLIDGHARSSEHSQEHAIKYPALCSALMFAEADYHNAN